MKVTDAGFFRSLVRLADDGWRMGWHERNGGNLSFRLTEEELRSAEEELRPGAWVPLGFSVPELAGAAFAVTGTGRYFRDAAVKPEDTFGLIGLDGRGENYRILWGFAHGGRPTSELPTHLLTHAVKASLPGEPRRVVYHAHPSNIIALTFVLPLSDEVFTRELWEMFPECPLVFPEGVGVAPWMVPGGRAIAEATGDLMKRYNIVIWAHHGVFCAGEDPDAAFGLMHTVEKSAEILMKVLAVPGGKKQTVAPEQLRRLSEECAVDLPERFLRDKPGQNP